MSNPFIPPTTYITTNYIVTTSTGNYDLGELFVPNTSYIFTTTGSPTITSGLIDISGNTTGPWSYILIFTSSGTFTPVSSIASVNYILVGGGGGSGYSEVINFNTYWGGGGGGGDVSYNSFTPTNSNQYTVTVGAGGTSGAIGVPAASGGSSSISSFIVVPGGVGGLTGNDTSPHYAQGGASGNGNSGGNGSGAAPNANSPGGGGGGFSGAGGNATTSAPGAAGAGISITIPTLSVSTFGAGGIGGTDQNGGGGQAQPANSGCGGQQDGTNYPGASGIVILYF